MTAEVPPQGIDDIAAFCAELDVAPDPDEVLKRVGLDRARWQAAEERALATIADDVDRGDLSSSTRFRDSYEAKRGELLGAAVPAPASGAAQHAVIATPAPPSVAVPAAPVVPSEPSMPLKSPISIAFAGHADLDPDATAPPIPSASRRALPFDASAPVVKPAPLPLADQSGETAYGTIRTLSAPKAEPAPLAPPRAPPPAPVQEEPSIAAGTSEIDMSQIASALRARGVPFRRELGAPPAPPPPLAPAPAQRHESTGTEEVDLSKLGLKPAPFAQQGPPNTPSPPSTQASDPAAIRAQARATQVLPGGSADELPIPMARFAQIQAALARSRDRTSVLLQFRLTHLKWRALEQQMELAMSVHPHLRAEYEEQFRKAMQHGR